MSNIFGNIDIMTKALNASWKRNEVISNNIANVDTPNFKKSHVKFEELLHSYLQNDSIPGKTTHDNHIRIGVSSIEDINYKITTPQNYKTRRDGNNVDIDVEMAELAKNTITYDALSTRINGNFKKLKTVINEGR
ncbi:flagellar basal-body rod protein FlgB [Natronincola peptidivorans]|uniref:Flagellar basal body rod protein FlgB n=1 Tax=Natronincola peptidivorans TaxID=426128 RepID=A0A1H9YE05_9FIRM|nr:flagellar basal body rod protein FlgB [Natronincola peptidivorans]SES67206.1 flagellar basal-body rod protein FlgB [Natronincola peptidivorans]